jgi:DNA-binding transcriptional MerR regulator
MALKRAAMEPAPVLWRIGEVAKLTGVTTRTLRYWEELGLLQPASRTDGGERIYGAGDVRRVTRIREWQELLGFSLDEVKAVLSTGDVDVLDRVHFELRDADVSLSRRRALLDEAIAANDQLVGRLEDTMARIRALRDERAAIAVRLRESRDELELLSGAFNVADEFAGSASEWVIGAESGLIDAQRTPVQRQRLRRTA